LRRHQGSDEGNVYLPMCVELDPKTGEVVEMVRPLNPWMYLALNQRTMEMFSASSIAQPAMGDEECKHCLDLFCKFESKWPTSTDPKRQGDCCKCATMIQNNLLRYSNETHKNRAGQNMYTKAHRFQVPDAWTADECKEENLVFGDENKNNTRTEKGKGNEKKQSKGKVKPRKAKEEKEDEHNDNGKDKNKDDKDDDGGDKEEHADGRDDKEDKDDNDSNVRDHKIDKRDKDKDDKQDKDKDDKKDKDKDDNIANDYDDADKDVDKDKDKDVASNEIELAEEYDDDGEMDEEYDDR